MEVLHFRITPHGLSGREISEIRQQHPYKCVEKEIEVFICTGDPDDDYVDRITLYIYLWIPPAEEITNKTLHDWVYSHFESADLKGIREKTPAMMRADTIEKR